MQIIVIADETQEAELLMQAGTDLPDIHIIRNMDEWPGNILPEACIDLRFDGTPERVEWLGKKDCRLTVIHSVTGLLTETNTRFIRINGWNGFLRRNIAELSCLDNAMRKDADQLFSLLGKSTEWVPDICGLISARVVGSVINEAFYALEENISSEQDIDTAMKLGTNYPFGPFEWAQMIGLKNVYDLLRRLSDEEPRYQPCKLLEKKALA